MRYENYPERILKALVNAYKDNYEARNEGSDHIGILQYDKDILKSYASGDISTQELYDWTNYLEQKGYAYQSGRSDSGPLFKPTPEGIHYTYWYVRALSNPKLRLILIVITAIAAVIAAGVGIWQAVT
jgi:hypothetical protein